MVETRTLVNFVLDETGSMDVVRAATISGFNEYVGTLRRDGHQVGMTLVKFNSTKVEVVFVDKPIGEVPDLTWETYVPDTMTPLYDAIAHTIRAVDDALKGRDPKPAILCVIMTDGMENASKEFNRQRIFNLIKEKEGEGWTFAYLGANQDAWQIGVSIGVPGASTLTYDPKDPKGAMQRTACATADYLARGSRQSKSFYH